MRRSLTRFAGLAFVALALGAGSAHADDGGLDADRMDASQIDSGDVDAARGDAGPVDAGGDAIRDAAADPAVVALERDARDVLALVAGQLDPAIAPESLFDVSLLDEADVRVDAARLGALLREVDGGPPRGVKATSRPRARASDAGAEDAGVDPALWAARINLDRARLAFYDLPAARRAELLATQAQRQKSRETPPSEAQRRDHEAEDQRQEALRAAESARTQAERLVATELARLLGVERAQAALGEEVARKKAAIAEQREVTLGWQQRARDARARPGPSADATYDDLRRALRAARDALSVALDQLGGPPTEVPGPGPDALANLVMDVDTRAARSERERVETEARRLGAEEEALRRERAGQLFDEVHTLNAERLGLLAALSPEKRDAVTGFTAAGLDQAESEARQLTLILRYHRYVIGEWLLALRHPSQAFGGALAGGAVEIFEWVLALGAFAWWRRRSAALLRMGHRRAVEGDRRARLPAPSPATRGLAFLAQVHRPVEWLGLLFVLRWLLSDSTQQVLEVRVVSALAMWIFGAALVVDVVNALAATGRRNLPRRDEPDSAALRLRSLRLVGRVVVIFALILVISSMLVGRGTIYQWVFATCWLASIPMLLVLVRWWRNIVFRRTERVRRPSRVQRWVLANREGWWTSFAAAAAGGLYLFASGVGRGARNWVSRFVITRRVLAYLFRRQLDRREHTAVVGPIPDAAFEALGPERPSATWVANDSEEPLRRLDSRIRERKGGVIAIVGERGMGKSTALHRLRGLGVDAVLIESSLSADEESLRKSFVETLGLGPSATFEDAASALATSPRLHALLLDDAHRFVQPVVGGLAIFDKLLATASRHTRTTTWVFALDHVIWQFLERSRGARPLFDEVILLEPWGEEEIVSLLRSRTEEAALQPSFESLLEPLPATADDVDKQEALTQRAADYYRLLWDAATGNPGVALHMWRRSLGTDGDGKTAVRPSNPLDTSDLERLPDASVFVLRAVLQLAPASSERIARGGSIRLSEVADALRYATSRGYIEEHGGGYRVTWTWFRAVTLFLQRKHLLINR